MIIILWTSFVKGFKSLFPLSPIINSYFKYTDIYSNYYRYNEGLIKIETVEVTQPEFPQIYTLANLQKLHPDFIGVINYINILTLCSIYSKQHTESNETY